MYGKTNNVDIARLPTIVGSRNQFNYPVRHFTTFNVGEITPIYHNMLVEAGDTISISFATILRTTTMLFPSYDSLICEIFAFGITNNNLYEHWEELQGQVTTADWETLPEYSLPQILIPEGTKIDTHHILAHLGWGIQADNYSGSKMGVDFYNYICNEWFNNTQTTPYVLWSKGDSDVTYDGTSLTGGLLRKANRMPDYFSAGTVEPLRQQVNIPVTEMSVIGNGKAMGLISGTGKESYLNTNNSGNNQMLTAPGMNGNTDELGSAAIAGTDYTNGITGLHTDPTKSGVITDINSATIAFNTMRMAAAQTQIFEADTYFGTRSRDIVKSRWGVNTSSESLHIPEFLGYAKFPLSVYQVPQTSATSGENLLGELGAYSETAQTGHLFTKSFDFWANIMILVVVRQESHSYAQGLPVQYSKKRRFDFHWKELEHLGFIPTYKKELYITGTSADDEVFNYRPIFQEYRFERDMVTGEFNPSYSQSMDYELYVDDYDAEDGTLGEAPTFAQEWVEETPVNVDRTLHYDHETLDQIKMAIKFDIKKTSVLSQYGYPGLTRF